MASGQRSTTPGEHQEIWRAATRFIEDHHAETLAVDDLARAAVTSRRQLQRVFATVGSTTVRTYLTEVRMRRAAELVISSEEPLAAIARAVGYGHASSFIKAFRRRHGRTPHELRREHRAAARGGVRDERTGHGHRAGALVSDVSRQAYGARRLRPVMSV